MHRRFDRPGTRPFAGVSRTAVATLVAVGALIITGCAPEDSAPSPTSIAPSATAGATATPSPTPAAPQFDAEGTAEDNLPIFALVVDDVWDSEEQAEGRAYVDALTAVGFDKSAMEVTEDYSTVGNRAESIQFSVLWGDDCLVGQVGPATGDPVALIVPVLAEGTCLIGDTRAIDW